jgi:dipeptidyl aminopeptidase/acylaminoacyl peptidase
LLLTAIVEESFDLEGGTPVPYFRITCLISFVIISSLSPLLGQKNKKSPVSPQDYGKWESITSGQFSPDGKWLAVEVSRIDEKDELQIHRIEDSHVITIKFASNPSFSSDGEWIAYAIQEPVEEDADTQRKQMGYTHLLTEASTTIPEVESFSFSGRNPHLLLKRYPADENVSVSTVTIQSLSKESNVSFAKVKESAWQTSGDLLAFVTEDEEMDNNVQLYEPNSGNLRTLEATNWKYTGLAWRNESSDLAFFQSVTKDSLPHAPQTVIMCKHLELNRVCSSLDETMTEEILPDHNIVSYRSISWSEDGSSLFFGVKATPIEMGTSAETEASTSMSEKPEVEIWNSFDRRVIPEQKRDSLEDLRRSDLAVWHPNEHRVLVLTDDSMTDPLLHAGGQVVTATDQTPFDFASMFGRPKEDVYAIDPSSGEHLARISAVSFPWQVSPTGKYLSYFGREAYHVVDLSSGVESTISNAALTDFNNREFDHPVEEKPPFGFAGWSKDGQSIVVYDKYDMWQLDVTGSAKKLTNGSMDQIIHRYINLDEEKYIDLETDLYLQLEGEWTLNHGFARLQNGNVETLVYEDNNLNQLSKASQADIYAYIAQDFDDPPDYFVANSSLSDTKQITRINSFHNDYDWGKSGLVQYKNHRGKQLKGALFYPANYDPSQTYPMITYIYEKRSQSAKQYMPPSERSYYNWSVWTSLGYFVWQPDIVFDARDPGISSTQTMEHSILAVIEQGIGVDPTRIGLIGHSWGGYQTAFAVTNTDIFAAAVAGAPLTNLISMYGSIFWASSQPESGHFETGQERMEVPYWEDLDAYIRNSAVFNVEKLNTPLMLEVGDADRNVDWRQSIEYYNAARRAGKPLTMVAYHDEDHGLRKEANQVDYHRKILRWFGHYLKGEKAPPWVTAPIPYLQQKR